MKLVNGKWLSEAERELLEEKLQLEREERVLACAEAFYLRNQTYERLVSDQELQVFAQAAAGTLEEMPPSEIVPLMRRALASAPQYPPKAPDLLRLWKGIEETVSDDGKTEKYGRANVGAYDDWEAQKARAQIAAQAALPEAMPELEITPEELMRRLRSPHTEIKSRRVEQEQENYSDERLLQRLFCDCGMETHHPARPGSNSRMRAAVLAFGRWLLENCPGQVWTPELGREKWGEWVTRQEEFLREGITAP